MTRISTAILIAALALTGCKKEESKPVTPPAAPSGGGTPGGSAPHTPASPLDSAKGAVDSAAAKAAEIFKASKDEAVAAGQKGVDSIKASIQSLRDKTPTIPALARDTYTKSVDGLDAGFKDLQTKFTALQNSTAETFDKLKADFEPALKSLTDQVAALTSKFGGK